MSRLTLTVACIAIAGVATLYALLRPPGLTVVESSHDAASTGPAITGPGIVRSAAPGRNASTTPRADAPRLPRGAGSRRAAFDAQFPAGEPSWAWSRVNHRELRRALPGNLAFDLAFPTDDPALLAQRAETRARWQREGVRVRAGRARIALVRTYFDERERVSTDYVAYTDALLDRYGDVLPPRDIGLLELARNLHLARLEEMPRQRAEALARSAEFEAKRNRWLIDQGRTASTNTETTTQQQVAQGRSP